MLDERLAALDAHARPVDRLLVQGAGDTDDRGAGIGVRLREEIAENLEAAADLADDILVRDEAILEDEFGIVGKAFAHLVVHAADGEAGAAALDQEAGREI